MSIVVCYEDYFLRPVPGSLGKEVFRVQTYIQCKVYRALFYATARIRLPCANQKIIKTVDFCNKILHFKQVILSLMGNSNWRKSIKLRGRFCLTARDSWTFPIEWSRERTVNVHYKQVKNALPAPQPKCSCEVLGRRWKTFEAYKYRTISMSYNA